MNSTDPANSAPYSVSITTFLAHRRMVLCLFVSTLVVVFLLSRSLDRANPPPSFLKSVALAGALGGFVSALRRFYSFDGSVPASPVVRVFGRSYLYVLVYSLIPPLLGAIGGVVLYVILAAELLKSGGVFPNFSLLPDGDPVRSHFQIFLYDWKPATAPDYAKAFVWAFAAGFSERIVPDLLGKLTAQAER